MEIEQLQQRIGYYFGDRRILLQALTHKSYGHEFLLSLPVALRDNERLEFLGDAVLDVVISDLLLEMYPEGCEGQLSKMRAALVNERTLAVVSRNIGLQDCLRLGKGENLTGGLQKASILSCGFEALVAAIYLDGGFQAVYPVVRHVFKSFLKDGEDWVQQHDHKTRLQELAQAHWKLTPEYLVLESRGPDHAKEFEVEVKLKEFSLARAVGSSKKAAEQNAARKALEQIEEVRTRVETTLGFTVEITP